VFLLKTVNVKLEENISITKEKDTIKTEDSAKNSISLVLDHKDAKVILLRNGFNINEFKAKKEEDGLNIYEKDDHLIEQVNLDSGLYFGDRDTEPRAALIAHLIKNPKTNDGKLLKPLDIFVINVHLTTIMKEREGIPKKDKEATEIRLDQLKTIFDGIISRYNLWKASGFLNRGEERYFDNPEEKSIKRYQPIWIIAGDFNFTPESLEYEVIKRMNFVDVVPNKGSGTKSSGRGNKASLTLDYIFAGPNFISLDPFIIEKGIDDNEVDHQTKASDHYPIWATIPIEIKEKDEDSEKNPCSNKADSDASENQTESKKDDKP
jgi:endonuclease/exonuclease/phosphatase family metal-dependent hydrolase